MTLEKVPFLRWEGGCASCQCGRVSQRRQWDRFHTGWPDAWTSGSPAVPAFLSAHWTPQKAAPAQSHLHSLASLERGKRKGGRERQRETQTEREREGESPVEETVSDPQYNDHHTQTWSNLSEWLLCTIEKVFLAVWDFVNQLSHTGVPLSLSGRAVWLCKWIVANSLWAERVSSHSGVICYINPLLTQKVETVKFLAQSNTADWRES